MTKNLKKKLGFTITELVIVIAVIAILAAVLIPTFSEVVKNSKKSHDDQYVKEMNVTLNAQTVANGNVAPKTYEELMTVLSQCGLTDTANPFLLAQDLKQDNAYLVWYPNTSKIILVDTTTKYSLQFSSASGMGNGVIVYDNENDVQGAQVGYLLCSNGNADMKYVANLYYNYYVVAGGNISAFAATYNAANTTANVKNKAWAACINAAVKNNKQGYSYNTNVADKIIDSAKVQATVEYSCLPEGTTSSTDYTTLDNAVKETVQTSVRQFMATVTTIANDATTKETISGKTMKIEVPAGTVVDMTEVSYTPIGNAYRKEADVKSGVNATTSWDFGGLTFENITIDEHTFISTGAEYQTESDCDYIGGAYAFTYGLLGTVVAPEGKTVTVANVNVTGLTVNLNGAHQDVDGENMNAVSDMAGVVCGYTQGNVIVKDVTIIGNKTEGQKGTFKGYDGVAGVIGRAYANKTSKTIKLENVAVSNLAIEGQRRAAGLIGYTNSTVVDIKNVTMDNVSVFSKRTDGKTGSMWASLIGDTQNTTWTINGFTVTNSTATVDPLVDTARYLRQGDVFILHIQGGNANVINCTTGGMSINGTAYNGNYTAAQDLAA